MSEKGKQERKTLVGNRRARFEYEIEESIEAGVSLVGSEVKSIRAGQVQFGDAYCALSRNELMVYNLLIAEYPQAHAQNHDPRRPRKLLVHRRELEKLRAAVERSGMTLVPLDLHTQGRHIKMEIGIARGKKAHDKRESIRERETKREMERAAKE